MEDWKKDLGKLVFSTGNTEDKGSDENEETVGILPEEQNIRIWLDRKNRRGKAATLIIGFEGSDNEFETMAKSLKKLCGVGGSFKNGEILLQGDQRKKVLDYLLKKGFKNTKLAGG